MRVYGSSPLYNYVELVFRSKRLFIACVVLALVAAGGISAYRAGSYTAQALVYLTGNETSGATVKDEAQKGSIQYKLNLLSVSTKDPQFVKDAFRDHGLNAGLTEEQFDKFCKDARTALTFASGNNVLEISIRWQDDRADKIISAFYSAFSRRVLEEETVADHIETEALQNRLSEYTAKQKLIEQKVIDFKEKALRRDDAPGEYTTGVAQLDGERQTIRNYENALNQTKMQLAEVSRQLQETPQFVEDVQLYSNPRLQAFQDKKAELEIQLEDLKSKYQDADPRVRRVQDEIATVEKFLKAATHAPKAEGSDPTQVRKVINPQWVRLDSARSDLEIQVQAQDVAVAEARTTLAKMQKRAAESPKVMASFIWMTKDLALYTGIRDNLRAKLEQAQMSEKQERELHLAEMKMIVPPTSEAETLGAKTSLFYVGGLLIGLVVAFAFSLLGETLDHSLRTPVEVEKYLNKPVLAVLPRMDTPRMPRRLGPGKDAAQPTLPAA